MASLFLTLSPRGQRPDKQVIENQLRTALEQLPGARIKVGFGGSGEKYDMVLAGEDADALQKQLLKLKRDPNYSQSRQHYFQCQFSSSRNCRAS